MLYDSLEKVLRPLSLFRKLCRSPESYAAVQNVVPLFRKLCLCSESCASFLSESYGLSYGLYHETSSFFFFCVFCPVFFFVFVFCPVGCFKKLSQFCSYSEMVSTNKGVN